MTHVYLLQGLLISKDGNEPIKTLTHVYETYEYCQKQLNSYTRTSEGESTWVSLGWQFQTFALEVEGE